MFNKNELINIIEDEIKLFEDYEYFYPTIREYNKKIILYLDEGYNFSEAHKIILNDIENIMRASQPSIERIIQDTGKNMEQARKTIAGLNFQRIVAYSLMNNVLYDNIPEVVIMVGKKRVEFKDFIKRHLTIFVGDGIQKPDSDILIFNPNKEDTPIMIISCKTSLRERAGQTYRWKLLYDLAKTDCEHYKCEKSCPKNKYGVTIDNDRDIIVGFITTDFYNEIDRPQNKGMMDFFDFTFVGKKIIDKNNIKSLDGIVDYINNVFN
jgi:type II restriction enzyme